MSIDQRGHGDSEWAPDGDYSLAAFRDDIISVARSLGRPVLIGASLGGTSSLAALGDTADDPCGRGLVLVDVAPNIEREGAERIRRFMTEHMDEGFASLEEVADAVHAYNPHRPAPPTSMVSARTSASATTAAGTGTGIRRSSAEAVGRRREPRHAS